MKFRNTFASVLMMTVLFTQSAVFAGLPQIAFAEEIVSADGSATTSEDAGENTSSDETNESVDERTDASSGEDLSVDESSEEVVADANETEEVIEENKSSEEKVNQTEDTSTLVEETPVSDGEVVKEKTEEVIETMSSENTVQTQNTYQFPGYNFGGSYSSGGLSVYNYTSSNTNTNSSTDSENHEVVSYTLNNSCDFSCLADISTSGNGDIQTIGVSYNTAEKDLEEIAAQFGYTINANQDQLPIERWRLETAEDFTFEVTLLAREAAYRHEIGYYSWFDIGTYKAIGKTGNTVVGSAPYMTVGDQVSFTIGDGKQFGFAIKSYDNGVYRGTHATERAANSDDMTVDNALVYKVNDGYIIGFEDLPANGPRDNDFNDVVLLVRPTDCDDNNGGEDPKGIDLSVSKTASVATTTVGTSFTYTISLTNNGPEHATDVTVYDAMPTGLTILNKDATVGTFDQNTLVWTVGDLTAQDTQTLTLTVSANTTGTYVNTAVATSTSSKTDTDLDNNSDTVTVVVGEDNSGGENMCLAYVTPFGNDSSISTGESFESTEKTLQDILDENGYGSVDADADQKPYEKWGIANDKSVTFEVRVLGKQAYYEDIFGVYKAGDLDSFEALGRTGVIPAPATTTAPLTQVGEGQVFTMEDGDTFGLAIKAYDPNGPFIQTFATENDLNIDTNSDHAIVFEVADGYIVAFEDIPAGWVRDNDYNDLVLLITPISCSDIPSNGDKGIDLSVSKTASVATTTANASFTYTISVTNAGPETATGVEVTDQIPAGVTLTSATTTVGNYSTTTNVWTIDSLAPSSSETLTLSVTVASSTTGDIVNTATASSTDGKTDKDPNNNSDTVTVTVTDGNGGGGGGNTGIDLSVSKTASVATTTVNTSFTYTISVTNSGPESAEGVEVTDMLPEGIVFGSATSTTGSYATSTGIWTVGTLANNTSETLTLTVTASTTGDIANTATATSTGGKTDNNPDNNTSTSTVTVTDGNGGGGGGNTGIDLSVSKTGSISEVDETDVEFTYTISVTNSGPETATDIEVADELPAAVEFVSATSTTGTYATSTHIWTIDSLANGASATLTITVKVLSIDEDFTNTATATSTGGKTDNNPDNNTDTHTVTIPDDNGGGGGGSSGGGGGGGSSSGGGGGGTVNIVGGSGDIDVSAPQCEYLKEFLRYGYNNNPVEVIKLQAFLNSFENESLAVDGFFDLSTDAAVRRFQVKYFNDILEPWGHTDSTGYVYILTKKKVNEIFCNRAFPVTPGEAQEIVEFRAFLESLRARGIDTTDFEGGIGGDLGGDDNGLATDTTGTTSGLGDFFKDLFGGGDSEDTATSTATSTSQFASTLKNLAAAALVFPADTGDALGCLIVLLIILLIIYVLGTVIVNGMSDNKPMEVVRRRKIIAFMIGVVIAIVIAFLAPYPCIILPLILILIVLIIWYFVRRKESKPEEMNKEFSL